MLNRKDLAITFFRASGPGGQKKNKTESAVRIKHLPTGILVVAAEERSQQRNLEKALKRLDERLQAQRRRPVKRIATRPGRGARERRLQQKRQRSEVKSGRKNWQE
ncbi:MAG: peptide chain release factor-like protein [Desulfuromonadaceae bacterium]|nr:peptide chain release factor-like protein [Desulfuromonadaceae bacterium]